MYTPKQIDALNKLTKDLFNVLTVDDILIVRGKAIFARGQQLSEKDKISVTEGASGLKNNFLLKILLNEMKLISNEMMYKQSKSFDDMIGGKWMLYTLDVLEKKIDNLSKL